MDDIIEGTISQDEIARAATVYDEAKRTGGDTEITARFQYAYALLRSERIQDMQHGVSLFENLYYDDQAARRDYLYYIAIGQTRLKKYKLALDCVEQFLQFEPENRQAKQLKKFIKDKLTKEGLLGIALTGGAALVIGGLIGLGMSMAKK